MEPEQTEDLEQLELDAERVAAAVVFKQLMAHEEPSIAMVIPWTGTDDEKQEALNDIASMVLQFTISRIHRALMAGGEPDELAIQLTVFTNQDAPPKPQLVVPKKEFVLP